MFNRSTVFIVGAGASAELSLPTGDVLMEKIAKGTRFRFEFGRQTAGDENLFGALRARFKDDFEQINKFTRAGNELAETVPTFPSIDEALHWWKTRPEIVELGKAAIVQYILEAERQSLLGLKRDTGRVDVDDAKETWLYTFLSMALAGRDRESVTTAFERLTIINFNYDRTIEQFIYWALQQRAGVSSEVAAEAVSRIKIIRPYGSIGKLDWSGKHEAPFGVQSSDIFSLSENIRTFTEQASETHISSEIDESLESAQVIVLLGFGFHQQNLALFIPGTGRGRANARTVMATAYGVDARNYDAISNRLANSVGVNTRPLLVPLMSHQLLKQLRPMIAMAAA